MAHWVLNCPHCNSEFEHSEITPVLTVSEYCFPRKPDFSMEGLRLECPYCNKPSIFHREQLTYRAA
jgi:hypothetical protein